MTERVRAGSLTRYRYDRNGSIVSEEEEGRRSEYRYDLLNRQIYVRTPDGKEQENLYDGEGLRAGLVENGKKTTFLYHNGEIFAECDGESAPIRRYVSGLGLSHVQTADGAYHAYHQDEQGSTAYITGQGRIPENIYQYDAFGNLTERKEGITNRILYTGQQYDQETGQYYLRARYYNPVVGRFLQEDTYRGDGLNLYAYCANNPVVYYDPSGHDGCGNETTQKKQPATQGGQASSDSQKILGGSFKDVNAGRGADEVGHHLPQNAYNTGELGMTRGEDPALLMTKEDHALTRTYKGRGRQTMIDDAGLNARQRMAEDIKNIRENFGTKYNEGLLEAIKYAKTLPQFQK